MSISPPTAVQVRDGEVSPFKTAVHWWQTLSFRLGLVINLTALIVMGAFWLLDYRHQWATHVSHESERLREEARVLAAARSHLSDDAEFAAFVDTFCHQMQGSVSPDHHIMVIDAAGSATASSRAHVGPVLESKLLDRPIRPTDEFLLDGRRYVLVMIPVPGGERIVVTQSLAAVGQILHSQAISRALSLALLATLVFGCTSITLLAWVRDPLKTLVHSVRAIALREFQTRIRPSGPAELRFVAAGFNDMAAALAAVDKQQQAQMRRARAIQTALLPNTLCVNGGCEITAFFEPAESVGGDLYDVVPLVDESVLVAVLDVSGHGVAPALYTALLRTVLRHTARLTSDPGQIFEVMNREFVCVSGVSGDFATCFLCRIDGATGAVSYASAGHDAGLLIDATGSMRVLEVHGLPLGVNETEAYVTGKAELSPDARLFLYTDGLHEVANEGGVLFGRDRLRETLKKTFARAPGEQPSAVIGAVRGWAGSKEFSDDVTLLCIRRLDQPGPSRTRHLPAAP